MGQWNDEARQCSLDIVEESLGEIAEQIADFNGEIAVHKLAELVHLDRSIHEWVGGQDVPKNLIEAAQIIKELEEYNPHDSGLWEGLEPIEAVKAMGYFHFERAVTVMCYEMLEEILALDFGDANENGDLIQDKVEAIIDEYLSGKGQ